MPWKVSQRWDTVSYTHLDVYKRQAADGTVIPADGLIEIISFDENGYGKVATDLPFGSYYV